MANAPFTDEVLEVGRLFFAAGIMETQAEAEAEVEAAAEAEVMEVHEASPEL